MENWKTTLPAGAAILLLLAPVSVDRPAYAAEAKPAEKTTYVDHVRPILREHCFTCHNQDKAKNDLALDSYERLMTGGASGAVIEAGDPDSSYLWMLVSHQDQPNMPPNQDKLPEAKLAIIKRWIAGGALKDSGSTAKAAKKPGLDLALSGGARRPEGPAIMPEGLVRQPAVYTPRPGAATAIASSPWAPVVALAGQKQIVLHHCDTGQLLGVLPFPEGIAQVLKFSRSGSLLVAGGGKNVSRGLVVVFDVKTGRRMFEVGDELDTVLAADINPSQTHIALGGPQKIVRVYSTADGSLVYEIRAHTDWIYAVEFSPDGVLLATADRGGGLMVWEADTGRPYLNLEGHKEAATDVSWRADSNVLASSSEDGTVKLWEMENGRQLKSINAHGGGVTSIDFAQDGRFATAGRDNLVKLWDPGGKQLRAFAPLGEPALEVALTHDGGRVVAGDWSGDTRMWNTADGVEVAKLPANPPTLEMVAKSAQERAGAAQQAAGKAAAELAEADKTLAQGKAAAANAAQQSVQKAEAAKAAAAVAAAARKAAAEAKEKKEALQKAAGEAEAAAKQAADQAATWKVAADKLAAAGAQAQKARDAKTAAAEAAAKAAAEAQAAAQHAASELEAFQKSPKPSG